MTTPNDPRLVAWSCQVYGALLRAYPRRFRLQYRQEMALVFRDSYRQAYRQRGWPGLLSVWMGGLADLSVNAPKELTAALAEETALRAWGRSCSGCNNEVAPDWQRCVYCGTCLSESTTYPTRVAPVRHSLAGAINTYLEHEKRAALAQLDETLPSERPGGGW
ncbi:MAG: hypothetical protein JOZ41_06655 [Chloroflexi bacterium]|nr:hypothetical protein [Chloroflexota bacterium]